MLTRDVALSALRNAGCSEDVIKHCLTVERKAVEIAEKIKGNGHKVDLELVRVGAILHDIGRAVTHGISHGIEGAKILRKLGLEDFVGFAENHIGAGIPRDEAEMLGLPSKDFLPKSLEEKIVAYADKLVSGNVSISFEEAREQFKAQIGAGENHPALKRLDALHAQIQSFMAKRKEE
jgi:uncharacterized protein